MSFYPANVPNPFQNKDGLNATVFNAVQPNLDGDMVWTPPPPPQTPSIMDLVNFNWLSPAAMASQVPLAMPSIDAMMAAVSMTQPVAAAAPELLPAPQTEPASEPELLPFPMIEPPPNVVAPPAETIDGPEILPPPTVEPPDLPVEPPPVRRLPVVDGGFETVTDPDKINEYHPGLTVVASCKQAEKAYYADPNDYSKGGAFTQKWHTEMGNGAKLGDALRTALDTTYQNGAQTPSASGFDQDAQDTMNTGLGQDAYAVVVAASEGTTSQVAGFNQDVDDVAAMLQAAGIPTDHIKILKGPQPADVLTAISDAGNQDPSKFVFYYSGHATNEGRQGQLALNADGDTLSEDALTAALSSSAVNYKFSILDACYSQTFQGTEFDKTIMT